MAYKDTVLATAASDLRVFYMLDETSGTVATDSGPQAEHATYVSADQFDLRLGRVPIVEGALASVALNPVTMAPSANRGYVYNDAIQLYNKASADFTVVMWLSNVRDGTPGLQALMQYATAAENQEFVLAIDASGDFFMRRQGSARVTFSSHNPTSTQGLPSSQGRYMVSFRQTITDIFFGINGREVDGGSYVAFPDFDQVTGSLTIGQSQTTYQTPQPGFDPLLADVQAFSFWQDRLQSSELTALYDAGKETPTPYELLQVPTPVDQTLPVIDNFTPASAIDDFATVGFDVTDWAVGDVALKVKAWINYPNGGEAGQFELVENDGVADDRYTVTRNTVGDVVSYTFLRKDGWPSSPFTVVVEVDDQKNAIVSAISPEYTVPEQEYPPDMRPKYNLQKQVIV